MQPGQTVLDLGSGAGFDCFLAARAVGPSGMVIGVDMTDDMLVKARENAQKNGFTNAVADIVATAPLPDEVRGDWAAYTGCMAGASQVRELEQMLEAVGFRRVRIAPKDTSRSFIREWLPGSRVEDYLVSATIEAIKPTAARS